MNAHTANRILMLLENNPYPQDIRVRREATTLADANYQITVIAPRRGNQPWRETIDGVQLYRFPEPPEGTGLLGYMLEYGWALVAIFLLSLWVWVRRGFDVIHVHNPPDMVVLVGLAYKAFGKKIVFDHHDIAPEMYTALFGKQGMVYRVLLLFERLACQLADHVIVTNESYKQVDMTRNKVAATQLTVVRNGPDPRYLHPIPADPTLGKPDKQTLCYVGEMGFHDGLDHLLRTVHHLVYVLERTDLHLLLVGSGSAYTTMKTMSQDLKLAEYVTFTGQVPHSDVLCYIGAADICVAPEPSNGYNDRSTVIKMMEYMAVGKAIVAFDLPEHRYSAQEAALYAHPNDEADFARQIVTLLDDPQLREQQGRLGRERVEQVLAWSYQAQQLLNAYRSLQEAEAQSIDDGQQQTKQRANRAPAKQL